MIQRPMVQQNIRYSEIVQKIETQSVGVGSQIAYDRIDMSTAMTPKMESRPESKKFVDRFCSPIPFDSKNAEV